MTALSTLCELHKANVRRLHPNLPESAVASANYSDANANGLTKCVVAYITLSGGWASRINTTGQMRPTGKTEVSAGRLKWVHGTTKRGTPDVLGVLNGKQLSIEIKIGKDRQSPAQIETEKSINASGGHYFCARDFESFFNWINQLK